MAEDIRSNVGIDISADSASAARRRANYALAVIFIVTMLNFLDRQVISIVAEPIKRDLGLSDTQLGLMTGLSFAVFYTTLAIPLAALADRWNRSRIIGIAIAVWSLMTVLCGLAGNFVQLFLARVGVGIGEAGSAPASHSLIADLFPPERRAGALGIMGAAVPVGAFLAYAGGGYVTEMFSWRVAFMLAGLPGILIALLIWFTVPDPRGKVSLAKAFQPVAGLFVRVHGMNYGELGWKLGVMVGITGGFGAWFGGKVGDMIGKRDPVLPLLVSGLVLLIAAPGMIAAIYAGNANLAIVLLGFPTFAATFYFGPSFAAVQALASDRTRAMAVAIYLMVAGLIGLGLGPVFVGGLSDYFAGGDRDLEASALQKALMVLALFNLWAGFHYWRVWTWMKRKQA
mgnify:CR=1 FL=1